MTFTEFILGMLEGKSDHYAMIRQALYAPTAPTRNRKQEQIGGRSFSAIISRLQKQGLIQRNQSGAIKLLQKGREHLELLRSRQNLPPHAHPGSMNQSSKVPNIIVLYDIPERRRRGRDWLRAELTSLDFRLLQKSAWIGVGPLPKEFPARLHELGIFNCVHVFAVQKRGTLE